MSILIHFPKKIIYYSDLRLFFHIFFASLKFPVSLFPTHKKILFDKLNHKNHRRQTINKNEKEKITRYTNLYFRLLGKLGLRNTCLTRSAVLCYVLRKFGFHAQINFGIPTHQGKNNLDPSFLGHCWVSLAHDDFKEEGYDTLSQYPLGQ